MNPEKSRKYGAEALEIYNELVKEAGRLLHGKDYYKICDLALQFGDKKFFEGLFQG